MEQEDKIPPAGLHPRLARKLLDKLENDDAFRKQFQESPEQALRSIGYQDPWACPPVSSGGSLASPEQIRQQRTKLEDSLTSIHGQTCTLDAQQGFFVK